MTIDCMHEDYYSTVAWVVDTADLGTA